MSFIQDTFALKDKVAAVIGGGGVLAGAMAKGLAQAGADVAILDLNTDNAEKMAASIKSLGVKSMALTVNATSKGDLQKAAEDIAAELGPTSILINAPGINSSTPFFDISE